MEEVKKSLSFMSEEKRKAVKQQIGRLELTEEEQQLKVVIKEKDKTIEELERRAEDLQHTRVDDVVICDLETTSARITAGDREAVNYTHLNSKSFTSLTTETYH